jgi:hypothetical protein
MSLQRNSRRNFLWCLFFRATVLQSWRTLGHGSGKWRKDQFFGAEKAVPKKKRGVKKAGPKKKASFAGL